MKLVNPGFERASASAFSAGSTRTTRSSSAPPNTSRRRSIRDADGGSRHEARARAPSALAAHRRRSARSSTRWPRRWRRRRTIVVVTKDSNITFSPDTLRAHGAQPRPRRRHGLRRARRGARRDGPGVIETILINRDARMLLTASAAGKGFGVGKVMMFRRSDLARAGGVAAMGYTIAEDSALCERLRGVRPAHRLLGEHGRPGDRRADAWRDVHARQARWAVIRRAEEPASFVLRARWPAPYRRRWRRALAAAARRGSALGGPGSASTLCRLVRCSNSPSPRYKRWPLSPWAPLALLGRDARAARRLERAPGSRAR